MRFYVSVGARGVVFRIGMAATGVMGSLTYWYGSRRRSACPTDQLSQPAAHPGIPMAEAHPPRSFKRHPGARPVVLAVAPTPVRRAAGNGTR
jgi:hypothetical protein